MAAIQAGRRGRRVAALDGARRLGAKILVAGGGRCNVTHEEVTERAFAGATPPAIRKVLRRFDVPQTVAFFAELGVDLKREDTGKLFPVTDSARTVLDALLRAAREADCRLECEHRVTSVERDGADFVVRGDWGELRAPRVVLATGGRSLPKTGSDGGGYALARELGHSITERVLPALVPLRLADGHPLRELPGLSAPVRLTVRAGTGRRIAAMEGDLLCTHFGVSGPVVLDVSRYFTHAVLDDPDAWLEVDWRPDRTAEALDEQLRAGGKRSALTVVREGLPERLARALCAIAEVGAGTACAALRRDERRRLVGALGALRLPVTGDRGFAHAEVTAGGVPLAEVDLARMESRATPALHLCGEICDVDGRIGGFNFQWAWASGSVVGGAI